MASVLHTALSLKQHIPPWSHVESINPSENVFHKKWSQTWEVFCNCCVFRAVTSHQVLLILKISMVVFEFMGNYEF